MYLISAFGEMKSRKITKAGKWVYDETANFPVYIVKLNYDFWYEVGKADGMLEDGEKEELNNEGALYYVCFRSDPVKVPGWVDSEGFKSIQEAQSYAESKVPGKIQWGTEPVGGADSAR